MIKRFLKATSIVFSLGHDRIIEAIRRDETGLLNETGLHQELETEIKRCAAFRRHFLVLYLETKTNNLQRFIGKLKASVCPIDILARVGEKRFVVVFVEIQRRQDGQIVNQFKYSLGEDVAIGYCRFNGRQSIQTVLKNADNCMKKRRGA